MFRYLFILASFLSLLPAMSACLACLTIQCVKIRAMDY